MRNLSIDISFDDIIEELVRDASEGEVLNFIDVIVDRASWYYPTFKEQVINRIKEK